MAAYSIDVKPFPAATEEPTGPEGSEASTIVSSFEGHPYFAPSPLTVEPFPQISSFTSKPHGCIPKPGLPIDSSSGSLGEGIVWLVSMSVSGAEDEAINEYPDDVFV